MTGEPVSGISFLAGKMVSSLQLSLGVIVSLHRRSIGTSPSSARAYTKIILIPTLNSDAATDLTLRAFYLSAVHGPWPLAMAMVHRSLSAAIL